MRRGKGKRALAGLLTMTLYVELFFLPAPATLEGVAVWGYSERLAQCELAGKQGYVDAGRNVVIPLQYDSIVSFRLGIAAISLNGKLGVIRQDGQCLIQPGYGTLLPIDCGFYIVQRGSGWGVVSILPFLDGAGSTTNVLYEPSRDQVQVAKQGEAQVPTPTKGSTVIKIPVYSLPGILATKGVPSTRSPLTWGELSSFSDVSLQDWFALWMGVTYNMRLTSDVGKNRYVPGQTLTVAETLKLVAMIEGRYQGNDFHLSAEGGPYQHVPAVGCCLVSGMIQKGNSTERNYGRAVVQQEVTELLAATSLAKTMPELSSLARVKVSMPDIRSGDEGMEAIYSLYTKGILSGVDSRLAFQPKGTFARTETAAVIFHMVRTEQCLLLWS